jgi:hypothetical protein
VRVISEIKGSGVFKSDLEYTNDRVVKIGGSDSNVEQVCDNIQFYIMTRMLDMARFELSCPNLDQCHAKSIRMFDDIAGKSYAQVYDILMTKCNKLSKQFDGLIKVMDEFEKHLLSKISKLAEINISLPDIVFIPDTEILIYRPDILKYTMDKIINYVNSINVNSILCTPVVSNIEPVPEFKVNALSWDTLIEHPSGQTSDEYISSMQKSLNSEMIVAEYANSVEKYQADVINHMNAVYDILKKIIKGLTCH